MAMKAKVATSGITVFVFFAALLMLCAGICRAQGSQARIATTIDSASRVTIAGSHPAAARSANDAGRLAGTTKLEGISLVFSRSAAQEADLQALLVAQQNPASPQYQEWLTPDQFAARFGIADSDLAEVQVWLEGQGFTVEAISRSRNRITFSGTVGQVETTFSTEIHNYKSASGETHFAPATDLSVPAALGSVVQTVGNLSSFRPRPRFRTNAVRANFTQSGTQAHYLTPLDVATVYDINAAYNAGYTGTGQTIAVVGQSAVLPTDITNFQTALGLSTKVPTMILEPGTGVSAVVAGDETESDLDLEYSGAIARGATIAFYYTGNSQNSNVFDALQYVIEEDAAQIITSSYGNCEYDLGQTAFSQFNAIFAQAAAQGQTLIASAGDDGSTDCAEDTNLTVAQQEQLNVDFPGSSPYFVSVGGSEFPVSDVASGNTTYWTAAGSSSVLSTALSYIPEQVWNDDALGHGLSAGGGGTSIFAARPSWQTGVTGIPSGSYRLVPDISLAASPNYPGYLFCSSDDTQNGADVPNSCSNGLFNGTGSNAELTVAGGTSFAAPIFAGMVAIINQGTGKTTGQGVIDSTLYSLASNATTYASAFHDITIGNNECTAGTRYCDSAGQSEWPAGTGYDEASGLGSVDLYKLLTAWPTGTVTPTGPTLAAATVTLSAATLNPVSGASDVITIKVTSGSSTVTATPTGSISVSVNGVVVNAALALSGGSTTYTFSSTITGTDYIEATYSGDSNYAASTGDISLTVGGSTTTSGTFAVAATSVTVAAGATGTSTVTVTPSNGFTGTIAWTVASVPSLTDACYDINDVTISGTTAVTTTLTLYTTSSECSGAAAAVQGVSGHSNRRAFLGGASAAKAQSPAGRRSAPFTVATLAALLGLGFLGRRSRSLRQLGAARFVLAFALAGLAGIAISGCGSGTSAASGGTNAAAGTYDLTVTGTASTSITASGTLTLTIQ